VKKLHTDVLRSSNINTTTTSSNTPRTREAESLHFPDRISANERELAMMYLNPIGDDQQQDVLDEWNGRLTAANRRSTPIENPIGYLASLCRRVKTGEFQITIGLRVRENRERESRRAVEEKRRGEKERKKQEELVQSLQERAGSTGKSNIQRRMEQISKKRKNNGKQQPTE